MWRILLDTNFLMIPVQFGVDIFKEIERILPVKYELVTISPVVEELKQISSGRNRDSRAARVALQLIEQKSIKVLPTKEKEADKALLGLAKDSVIVATSDRELRKILGKEGVPVIYLKEKSHLEIEGMEV